MAAAAAPPGEYRLGQVLAEVGPDGYVRLPGTPYLAGSALTMDRAIDNAARFAGLSLEDALRLAGRQPRTLFGDLGGGATRGERADLVILREGPPLTVVATIVEGEVVFRADYRPHDQCPMTNDQRRIGRCTWFIGDWDLVIGH